MELVLALGGLLIGFALSFFLWWLLNHRLVPSLSFGSGISKLPFGADGRVVYRLKIENTGRRDIIDLECRARMHLPKMNVLRPEGKMNTRIIEIPLHQPHLFVLKSKKTRQLWLDLSEATTEYLPAEAAARIGSEKDGSLEALFELRSDSYLLVQVLAYDSFSGARKYYVSQKYHLDDVVLGYFEGLEMVRVTPESIAADQAKWDVVEPPSQSSA